MSTQAVCLPETEEVKPLLRRWRRQVGRRLRIGVPLTRDVVAIDLRMRGAWQPVVSVERLRFVVTHDDVLDGASRIRVVEYGVRRIDCGVSLGGAELQSWEKDLALEPLGWSRAERFDVDDNSRLRLALRMESRLDRRSRRSRRVRRPGPALPAFFAAFRPEVESELTFDGPELHGLVHTSGRSIEELVRVRRRLVDRFVAYPLEWVSHLTDLAEAVYADVRDMPVRQSFDVEGPARDALTGYRGCCQFDFATSRFDR